MEKYNIKIMLNIENEIEMHYGLNDTTDEEVITDLIAKLLLRKYKDMDDLKYAEEIIDQSLIDYKVQELYNSIKDELDAWFSGKRCVNEHLYVNDEYVEKEIDNNSEDLIDFDEILK